MTPSFGRNQVWVHSFSGDQVVLGSLGDTHEGEALELDLDGRNCSLMGGQPAYCFYSPAAAAQAAPS